MHQSPIQQPNQIPWNKGKLSGQKRPLKLQEIWAIRFRLQLHDRTRDLALFNLAIDSKLRACDLMALTIRDIALLDVKHLGRSYCLIHESHYLRGVDSSK
jgi:hypothetical protein